MSTLPIVRMRIRQRGCQAERRWARDDDDDVYSAGVESVFFLVLELQISTPRSLKKPVQFPR